MTGVTSVPLRDTSCHSGLDGLVEVARIVTIGAFDGVHRGHVSLLDRTVARARATGATATAVTFEPLPAQVLNPTRFIGRICPPAEKVRYIAATGVDEIVSLAFDQDFSRQTPDEFLTQLAGKTWLRELWVGEAFALGRNRSGDIPTITKIGRMLGFTVNTVARLADGDDIVSSSGIRAAILAGDAATVIRGLGRPFRVTGPVIHGAHLGRTIGYPTANVAPPPELVPLADGIYVSEATLPDRAGPRPAMTYVGTRPTVNSGARLIETHLLDFDDDLYGQILDVDIWDHLRGDATFEGLDPLIAQLKADEAQTRAYFHRRGRPETPTTVVRGVYLDPRD
ncbi:MAG: riboflavin biosynthesis protein RibF [Propionibacteriaceae bacterium]|nr:riboflavin biosynthesis protein RibF [Propionibacteriaceae bacterium]